MKQHSPVKSGARNYKSKVPRLRGEGEAKAPEFIWESASPVARGPAVWFIGTMWSLKTLRQSPEGTRRATEST